MLVFFTKLSQEEAEKTYQDFKEWFAKNPARQNCHADLFTVRRSHLKEDLLEHCVEGVEL